MDALTELRETLAGHPVEISLRPDLPLVYVDPIQVGQVFRHMLMIAAGHAPPRSEIRVAASAWRDVVEVRVSDHGAPAPKRDRDSALEAFGERGDGLTVGTGLGLAIAKAIVVAHGGAVWLEDTPGGGATIVVSLPAGAGAPG